MSEANHSLLKSKHHQTLSKAFWEAKALVNSRHYICTDGHAAPRDVCDQDFFASGETLVNKFLSIVQPENADQKSILDVGCGIGRCTKFLAKHFKHVYAVDISDEMIRQAGESLKGVQNCSLQANNGEDLCGLAAQTVDYVFCQFVFQHIFSFEVKRRYLLEFARVLRPGGTAFVTVMVKAATSPLKEDGWNGNPITLAQIESIGAECGLEIAQVRPHGGREENRPWFREIFLEKANMLDGKVLG